MSCMFTETEGSGKLNFYLPYPPEPRTGAAGTP